MTKRIVHFEDDSKLSLHTAFRKLLAVKIPGLVVDFATNYDIFQKMASTYIYRAFILDIMTADTKVRNVNTGDLVSKHRIGIEILDQIRNGHFANQDRESLIIMRSARSIEPDITDICLSKGANYFFGAGSDDIKILNILMDYLK